MTLNAALAPLTAIPNWLAFLNVSEPGKRKPRKRPHNPHSDTRHPRQASVTEPRTWGTYAQTDAFARAAQMDGIGIVLTRNLGLTLIDLDDCIDDTGKLEPWAAALVTQFNSYTEYSPSGRGLHILVWGVVAALKTKRVEIYSTERYTTITGRPYGPVRPIRQAQAELEALRTKYAPPPPVERKPPSMANIDASDAAVIEVLCRNPKQSARWAGNVTGDRSGHLYGLINGLVWLCGDDPTRIERLVRQSGLYDPKRHEQNSGGGRSNLTVSVFNAIATWTGTLYKWPTPDPPQPTAQPPPLLTKLLSETHPAPRPFVESELRILLGWLFCGGLSVMLRGRTHDTTMAVIAVIIEIAIERRRLDSLSIGLEEIRRRAGLGSTSTVRAALKRLSRLLTHTADGDRITKADQYSFNLTTLDWALDLARSDDLLTCRKSHDENNLSEKIMRFGASEATYTAHVSDDVFSTGRGGIGRTLGNQMPGAGKFLPLLIHLMRCPPLPVTLQFWWTTAQLEDLTGRRYRAVANALSRGYALGILNRREENGIGRGRRFWYSLADDWEQRAAIAAVDMRTFGAGVDRAANAAIGLQMHADRLLCPDREGGPVLDAAQRETLRAWSKIANLEYKGLCQIADAAARLDKAAILATIAGAGNLNQRALHAARQFNATILIGEELSTRQSERLFRHWAALHGYYELARQDDVTRRQREAALKTIRLKRQADLPPRPVEKFIAAAPSIFLQRPLLAVTP